MVRRALNGFCAAIAGLFLLLPTVAEAGTCSTSAVQIKDGPSAAPEELIFYRLPYVGVDELELSLLAPDGTTLVRERLGLPLDSTGNAVEFLAFRPDLLTALHRQLDKSDRGVVFVATADGTEVQRLTWRGLLAASAALRVGGHIDPAGGPTDPGEPDTAGRLAGGIEAVGAASELLTVSPAPGSLEPEPALALWTSSTCAAACAAELDNCDAYCDPYGSGPGTCQWCYDQFDECIEFCQACPILSTRLDPAVPISFVPKPATLCLYDSFLDTSLYQKYRIQYKQTTTQISLNCDGTTTYTIVATNYFYRTCWHFLDTFCGDPDGPTSAVCTFL